MLMLYQLCKRRFSFAIHREQTEGRITPKIMYKIFKSLRFSKHFSDFSSDFDDF